MQKNILVPVGPHTKDLGAVHHAMALAKRIPARIFILQFDPTRDLDDPRQRKEDLLCDLIATARQAGLNVSYHTASGSFEKGVMGFIHEEAIHILVLGEEGSSLDRFLTRNKETISIPVIFVRQKDRKAKRRAKKGEPS